MLKVVCIPAYNEERIIQDVILECQKYADKILVCDDGSKDDTFNVAEKAGAVVLRHEKNLGKGAALKTLFAECKKMDAELIVTIDGDGQFLPEEIQKLTDPIKTDHFDIVIGNRFSQSEEMPSYRKAGNKMLDKFTKLAAQLPFEDTQSGFRAYSKNAIEKISFSTNGFGVDSEILVDAVKKDLKITEQNVTVLYNTGDKTSTKNPVSHSMGVIASILELIAINHPLKYLGIPGIILLVIGIVYSVTVMAIFNETRYFSIPSTLLALGSLVNECTEYKEGFIIKEIVKNCIKNNFNTKDFDKENNDKEEKQLENEEVLFIERTAYDINVSSLIAGLGLGGLAIALAAQDTIRNLLGGVTIFADKPFEVGDWVVVDGVEGTVEAVGFRSTRVRTFYNSLISVPNGNLMDSGIDNMGKRRWRRYKTTLGVAYHTKPDQLQAFVEGIRAIIQANPGMRQDYYIVEFHGFGATSLDILVYCFIDAEDWNQELRTRHVLNLDIMRLAESLQVEFAFPTQTLHIARMPGQPQELPEIPERTHLREVIDSFGPGGNNGQRIDQPITDGHESVLESPYAQADEG